MPKGPQWVKYFPERFLGGVETLSAMEELAYRRLCDLIDKSGGPVMLDDRKLSRFTKVGRRWREVKAALIADGKLFETPEGGLMNERCEATITEALHHIETYRAAGKASAASGKSLANLNRGPNGRSAARAKGNISKKNLARLHARGTGADHHNGKINGHDPSGRSAPLARQRKDLLEQKLMRFANATMSDSARHAAFVGLIGEDPEHSHQWWFDKLDQQMRAQHWDDVA